MLRYLRDERIVLAGAALRIFFRSELPCFACAIAPADGGSAKVAPLLSLTGEYATTFDLREFAAGTYDISIRSAAGTLTFGNSLVNRQITLGMDSKSTAVDPARVAETSYPGAEEAMTASVEVDFGSRRIRLFVRPASAPRPARTLRLQDLALGALRRDLLDYDPEGPLTISVPATVAREGKVEEHNLTIALDPKARPSDGPLVSCLMVTRDRPEQAAIAIGCFRRQTWPHRELVVLDSSLDDRLGQLISSFHDPSIRHIHLPGCPDSLGAMRNRSVAAARGVYVAQWDDNDLSHPVRLEAQLAILRTTGAQASVLMRELMWMPSARRLGILRIRPHENTILCERASMPPYDEVARGEDTRALMRIAASSAVCYADLAELYLFVAHGSNTRDEEHLPGISRSASATFEGPRYDLAVQALSRAYPLADYQAWFDAGVAARQPEPAPDVVEPVSPSP